MVRSGRAVNGVRQNLLQSSSSHQVYLDDCGVRHDVGCVSKMRERDRQTTVRRFCRSATLTSDANPTWDQTIAVVVPREYRNVPEEDLFLHLLVHLRERERENCPMQLQSDDPYCESGKRISSVT
eukprot:829521-Amphidinium_carterae.2